jgi:phage terminase large subunit-like protein
LTSAAREAEFEKHYADAVTRAQALSEALKGPGLAERFARLPKESRDEIIGQFSMVELAQLRYDWGTWARPKQDPDLSDIPHRILFWLGGRGSGKTLSGAQRLRRRIEAGAQGIAIVGPTFDDIERYQIMGEGGADGILSVFPPRLKPVYKPHKGLLYFHRATCSGCSSAEACGGALAYINSAEKPEFRGPNLDTVWCDEPAHWKHLETIWHNIELATRLDGPIELEIFFTGTPLPLQILREIIADEETVTILMSQSENAANLKAKYVARMQGKYGGTRLGDQELEGKILTDNPGALFRASVIDAHRVLTAPELEETAVSVDPGIATGPDNDPTGVIAGGRGVDQHIYIWVDATDDERAKPDKWGDDVVKTCKQNETDVVIVERNRGGDLVASNVRAAMRRKQGELASLALKIVEVLATRGKKIRAEPVATLAERGFIHFVGHLPKLEQEITEWDPSLGGKSPNRLDALVMLVWHLARLGEEEKKDYRSGFKALPQVSAALRAMQAGGRPGAPTGLAGALPRWPGGSKL